LLDLDTCVGAWPLLTTTTGAGAEQASRGWILLLLPPLLLKRKRELRKDHWMEIGIRKIRETSFIQSSETFHVPPDNPRTVSFWVGKVLTVQLVLRVGIVFEIYINKIKNKLGRSEKDQREVTGSNIFIIGGVLSYHILRTDQRME